MYVYILTVEPFYLFASRTPIIESAITANERDILTLNTPPSCDFHDLRFRRSAPQMAANRFSCFLEREIRRRHSSAICGFKKSGANGLETFEAVGTEIDDQRRLTGEALQAIANSLGIDACLAGDRGSGHVRASIELVDVVVDAFVD